MTYTLLKSKLHHLRVTQADLNYQGSMTIDEDLMDAANLLPYEKILVANVENGARLETYAIPGARGSGIACLNGAAAYLGTIGDRTIVMAFAQVSPEEAAEMNPLVVRLDEQNAIISRAF